MASAEAVKALKVKTGSLKRVTKELQMYQKERDREQGKVDKLKEQGANIHDIKQAELVLQESAMMIPETRSRLESALADLQSFLAENEEDVKDTEELTAAKEVIDAAQAVFGA